ncbi:MULTISPECIES: LTA synthase family protein [unclassified Methylobacterium]|uniref:LTA synthase family protein n=1 Tax=unclassified Methylobacterium TaxID=2615210 RepID=UPI0005BDA142|nr:MULTISPECIES: LTA synthase family protein [unclassified Methylobacterium]SFU79755.1 Phosphoglycerol transferase MdoB [Methylobacterium sp. UNCCL125]
MTTFLIATGLALAVCLALEVLAGDSLSRASLAPRDLGLRLLGYLLILLFWFAFSWRPWLAGLTCVITVAILIVVSRAKRSVIGEPLLFSDFALLPQVPRHPQLYYIPPLWDPRIAGPVLLTLAVTVFWYRTEPSVLPAATLPRVLALLGLPLALWLLVKAAPRPPLAGLIARWFPQPDLESDVTRVGLPASLLGYTARAMAGGEPVPEAPALPHGPGDDVVVVIQLESFVDPERLGGTKLPVMDLFRTRAAQYGRLRVPAHGAYTMRSEHAVLTGRPSDSLGFGRYDPYTSRSGDEPTSLARLARGRGYGTLFLHPFHRDFFRRARVMEAFGFADLVMGEAFTDTPRVGPYVGDIALGDRLLAEVRARQTPLFLFCVTMENHGPWKPGRLPGIDDPQAQYLHHVANTGQMVEDIVAGLDVIARERHQTITLCVFGDHAPSLPSCKPGFGGRTTDYALFRFGQPQGAPAQIDIAADELGRALRGILASAPADMAAGT